MTTNKSWEPKRHAACDECRSKKLKCGGERPRCLRCDTRGLPCVYALQKTMGRPKKRRAISDEDLLEDVSMSVTLEGNPGRWLYPPHLEQENDGQWFDGRGFGTALLPDLATVPWPPANGPDSQPDSVNGLTPQVFAVPESSNSGSGTSEASVGPGDSHLPINDNRSVSHSTQPESIDPCACLSSMYLSLSKMQNMKDFSFPSALHTIREGISTGYIVLHCDVCPKSFLTCVQNVQLLGMFVVGIADRYGKVLAAVDAEAAQATAEGRTLGFRMGDLQGGNTHLHSADPDVCLAQFNLDLAPDQWRKLVKRVIKGEVVSSPKGCCPSLQMLLDGMDERQRSWHEMIPSKEYPRPLTAEEIMMTQDPTADHPCLRMVKEARKIINHMSFD